MVQTSDGKADFAPDKKLGETGFIRPGTFVESVKASYPFYVIRTVGGLLYLIGMLIMAWNVAKTVASGRSVKVEVPAVNPAHA